MQATNTMGYTIQFLLMELESVGNIRLEEGCSTDPWYALGIIKCNDNHHKITEDTLQADFRIVSMLCTQQVYFLLRPPAVPLLSVRL